MNFAKEMLAEISYIRAFEEKAMSLTQTIPPRVLGSMHFCAGQEAVPLGAAAGLRDDDQMIATHRGHGWAIASGLDRRKIMAEICQRADGLNGGRGGSAYFLAPDTRFLGENSIVGAATTIACGAAISNLAHKNGRVATVSIGDGAMNQGSVSEAFAFAAARKLPVIFIVENNGWAELTPTAEVITVDRIAKRASGYGMPSATISGFDPIAVRDSIAQAAEHARAGNGPSLLEFKVPRLWGHYNRDIEHYRQKSDRQAAEAIDPEMLISKRLIAAGFMTQGEVDDVISNSKKITDEMTESILEGPASIAASALEHVISLEYSPEPTVTEKMEMTYLEAVTLAMRTELENDPMTLLYGEDVGKPGGIFGASRNLQREFGDQRVFDTPIAENAILGSAVGAAMTGMKPIVEIMFADFIYVALDQLVNQAANVRYMTRGKSNCPIVVRTQQGATPGACPQHTQSIEAVLAHIPGLKVALPATAEDAYALIRSAVADPDPCIIIESRGLYPEKSEVVITNGAEPVGKSRLRREGNDVSIITWGAMVPKALAAAEILAKQGSEAHVLDLRWLCPLDETALVAAANASKGKVVIAHEAVRSGGFAGEIALRLQELLVDSIAVRIRRVTTPDVRIPATPELQDAVIPSADDIVAAAITLI
ncbi:transketolase [Rhodobacteraceae bacterium Araon29]